MSNEIPKELQEKISSLRALSTIYSLLNQAYFPQKSFQLVDQSMNFIQILHQQVLEDASSHPQSNLIPELKDYIQSKEVK